MVVVLLLVQACTRGGDSSSVIGGSTGGAACTAFAGGQCVMTSAHVMEPAFYNKFLNGVVKVTTQVQGKRRVGPGIIVRLEKAAAVIITASHIINGDSKPYVMFKSSAESFSAKIVGHDKQPNGLAALKVEGQLPASLIELPLDVDFKASGGERAVVIGIPQGPPEVWATNVDAKMRSASEEAAFLITGAVQGDAGGPLFVEGKIIGLVTEVRESKDGSKEAVAVPVPILRQALRGFNVPLESIQFASSPIQSPITAGVALGPIEPSTAKLLRTAAPTVYLDQGWTDEERQEFYHLSSGTTLLPYDWFVALETDIGDQPFSDAVEPFGLLTDPNTISNPDLLPVGLGQTSTLSTKERMVGKTCAFCHTGQIHYQGQRIRIDGAPSLHYSALFVQALAESLTKTFLSEEKFQKFAIKILGSKGASDREEWAQLRGQLRRSIEAHTRLGSIDLSPIGWGFGRIDAMQRIQNTVFGRLDYDNLRFGNAPVSIPALWASWEYDWVHWNGSVQHPILRNIAEVLAAEPDLFNSIHLPHTPLTDKSDPFRSSINIKTLARLEELVRKLRAPSWPNAFPAINTKLAERGKDLYHGNKALGVASLCAHCHIPMPHAPNLHGQYLNVTMVPQSIIGTDPYYALSFSTRTASTGPLDKGKLSAPEAIQWVTAEITTRQGWQLAGDLQWRNLPNYIARPNTGVWATPPYLHNGSVPNVYELLSPARERHGCFYLSPSMEYDPVYLGYVIRACDSQPDPKDLSKRFAFDTRVAGNSNQGHEFDDTPECHTDNKGFGVLGCRLLPEDRLAIIEYLKTL